MVVFFLIERFFLVDSYALAPITNQIRQYLYPIICVIIEADLTLPANMASSAPRVAYEHGRGFGSLWKEGSSKRSISLFKVFFLYFPFLSGSKIQRMMHRAPLPFPSEMCNDRFTVPRQCFFLYFQPQRTILETWGSKSMDTSLSVCSCHLDFCQIDR